MLIEVDGGETKDDAAAGAQRFVTFLNQADKRFVWKRFENLGSGARSGRSALAVTDAVNGGNERAVGSAFNEGQIAGFDTDAGCE